MEMQMEMSYVIAVVITGLVVVFLGLVLLIAFISIIGSIFKSIDNKKKAQAEEKKPVQKAAPVVRVITPAEPAEDSDDDEVIAVIAAAVAMMSAAEGKNYRIRSVKAASSRGHAGNAWASAAMREATRPF